MSIGAVKQLRQRRRLARAGSAGLAPQAEITLEWSQLTCTLRGKDGTQRKLLSNVEGVARPGRQEPAISDRLSC